MTPVKLTDVVMGIRLNTAKQLIEAHKNLPKAKGILLEIKNANPEELENPQYVQDARNFLLKTHREVLTLLLEIARTENDTANIVEYSNQLGLPHHEETGSNDNYASSSSSGPSAIYPLDPNQWNSSFPVTDGSKVININPSKRTITILDPGTAPSRYNEELIVELHDHPYRPFSQIRPLNIDPIVQERQRLTEKTPGQSTPKAETIDHHFAQMLDYVIQYASELGTFRKTGPHHKVGSHQGKDFLTATVTRKNLKNGKEVKCIAEYTFYGKRGEAQYLYHRVLKPI